ncbi:hypothetical protein ACE38W_20525 [Chitinophaga sp. Hz27]|uniref:hypothetical protein n=1 Tax=Chitinophaga sp. Hz27 TaxID=3347169 RepID=UPI0035D6073A
MKIKHYGVFNKQHKTLNWENLRNDETEPSYFLPHKREEYIKQMGCGLHAETAKVIINEAAGLGIDKVFSIGSGIAAQEYQIKNQSDLHVVVSDYNPSVSRLKTFGIFDDVIRYDALKDPLPADHKTLVLFPRIDTEFEDEQLKAIFENCSKSNIQNICFIPAQLLTSNTVLSEVKVILISLLKGKSRVFCGYSRSKAAFSKLWNGYYTISKECFTDREFYFLKKI